MIYYVVKVLVSAILIVLISEISKRSTLMGAILASVPLVSVLALFWLYFDTKSIDRISAFSLQIVWLVIPSLALFITLPLLLKQGVNFYLSMFLSIGITVLCYLLMLFVLKHTGIKI
ncbi:MAG: DUF3147 family protein [Hydrogenovibrio sp.]|nr:DUF3147 family protein [Hydrogenovibrio sp.]